MKTIAILLAVGSIAQADIATIYSPGADDYTPVSPPSSVVSTAFDFTLNNSEWLNASGVLTNRVSLQNLTIYGRAVDAGYSGGIGIAIFKKNQTESWNYVGKSTWNNAPYGSAPLVGSNPFDFDNLILDTNVTYTAVFYGYQYAFNNLKSGDFISSLEGTKYSAYVGINGNPSIAAPAIGITYTDSHEAVYQENGSLWESTDEPPSIYHQDPGRFTPVVSFTVETIPNVPEPTASSLSLLGLATLMMRRRRV